ncbi:hypothetical protein N431DRAFT_451370 [Stipitochalara longipes BDJ]|nr:hypothetical protein N431DRAFT_451370 [Stipitochalara longipes BDJ]
MSKHLHTEEETHKLLDENVSILKVGKDISTRPKSLIGQKIFNFCSVIVNIALFITILFMLWKPEQQYHLDCGTTLAEAKQRGCVYDQLTVTWLPERCSQVGLQEYLDADKWRYWLDPHGTLPIHNISTYSNGSTIYTTDREHLTHCAYQLIRAADGLRKRGAVDKRARSFEHNEHCAKKLLKAALNAPGIDMINTRFQNSFGTCIIER